MKRNNILVVSGLVTSGLFIWNYIGNYKICDSLTMGGSSSNCPFVLTDLGINLLPVMPFFIFTLITYKMRDEVYRAWLRFSLIWVPLSMFLIFLAPEYSTDWMYPITKATVAFLSSVIYCAISGLLIAWKYFVSRRAS